MEQLPLLPGITATIISSKRITTRVLRSGPADGVPVLFLHGLMCSGSWWEESMLALPEQFQGIAHDQRGHGFSDRKVQVDATRGAADMAEDAFALLDSLNITKAHIVGHSSGGFIVWQMLRASPQRILSVTVVAPNSPYGIGGTSGEDEKLDNPDAAGTGSTILSKDLFRLLNEGVREDKGPTSPRGFMNSFFVHPPFRYHREEILLTSMFLTHREGDAAPGDTTISTYPPFIGPGKVGVVNSTSPIYTPDALLATHANTHKPPVLWVRGAHDLLISDAGIVSPSQPMVAQTRYVLEKYKQLGGSYAEVVMSDVGHSPFIENLAGFNSHFHAFLLQK